MSEGSYYSSGSSFGYDRKSERRKETKAPIKEEQDEDEEDYDDEDEEDEDEEDDDEDEGEWDEEGEEEGEKSTPSFFGTIFFVIISLTILYFSLGNFNSLNSSDTIYPAMFPFFDLIPTVFAFAVVLAIIIVIFQVISIR